MVNHFKELSEEEIELMLKAPAMVSVLIAGADGKIDNKEKSVAVSYAKLKTYSARKILLDYYNIVQKDFEDHMNNLIKELPDDHNERNKILEENLEKLNPILEKLDKTFAINFYESMKSFAKQTAEASGGILNMLSISVEESKLIDLKMIKNPDR